jgi:hypothetical protein
MKISIIGIKKEKIMKIIVSIFAVLLILSGGVWFLQGINVLPGSFMTGHIEWSIYGSIEILIGIGLLWFVNRRKASPPEEK